MRKILLALLVITLFSIAGLLPGILDATVRPSPGSIDTFDRGYGGTENDRALSIQQTFDGGYVVAGLTASFGAGGPDVWVLKVNSAGTVQWQNTYGGTGDDAATSVQQTKDGGYIVAGITKSFGAGGADIWVLKLNDLLGTVQWQKTYGGTGDDAASSIQQTKDGGYIVAGLTMSFGAGDVDVWVLKLNSVGTIVWQKTYGGTGPDYVSSVQQISDGGYVVAGWTWSSGAGGDDIWVLKLNSVGTIVWQKTYGGTGNDEATSVQQTKDGGYIVAGSTTSFGAGKNDFWVLKLNSAGTVQWQNTYGGTENEVANSVQQTKDGGYIVAGTTESFGAGEADLWVLKLSSAGTIAWQKTYGGNGDEEASSVRQTLNAGYVVAGYMNSFGAGSFDFWVLKLDAMGDIGLCSLGKTSSGTSAASTATLQVTTVVPATSTSTATATSVTGYVDRPVIRSVQC